MLAVVNSAAVNIRVHVSFQVRVFYFSRYMPRSGIAESYSNSIFSFLKNFRIVFTVAAPIFIPTDSVEGFPFLHTLSKIHCL